MKIVYLGSFTPRQNEMVLQKCSSLIASQSGNINQKNNYNSVVGTCCSLLGKTNDKRAIPLLLPLLHSPNPVTKGDAVRILKKLGYSVNATTPNSDTGNLK